ncbi:hypothetical protein, partial [Salmonella sp. gx-f5]|uniref:hypothetical protein n=1 Tax=Salmonella sp. gx-f5 TaxID=2582605 RepID=UPI001F433A1A
MTDRVQAGEYISVLLCSCFVPFPKCHSKQLSTPVWLHLIGNSQIISPRQKSSDRSNNILY